MLVRTVRLALLALGLQNPVPLAAQPVDPAAHVASMFRSDWGPLATGRLPNGLRYALLPRRQTGETGVGVVMRLEAGFIDEQRPGERGLTHLIEHLVFVSPTIAAPDELRRFQRVGLPLTYSAPTAATTEWRDTNYFLSTRTRSTTAIDTMLGLFREAAGELTFRQDVVDEQRADVMREMDGRKSGNATFAAFIRAVGPGSPGDLIDGQNHDDVPQASIGTIRALYKRLYRPDRAMVVVVGDVDPVAMRQLIELRFGDWSAPSPPVPRPSLTSLDSARIAPISYSAAPQTRGIAMMVVASPTAPPSPSRTGQIDAALTEMLVLRAVSNRLTASNPKLPPGAVGVLIRNGELGHRQLNVWYNFEPGAWAAGVASLGRDTCRIFVTGFTDDEWSQAKQDVLDDLDNRAAVQWQLANVEVARSLARAVADGRELIPPGEMLQRARAFLPGVTVLTGNAWWRSEWRAGPLHLRVETPDLAGVSSPLDAIRTAADSASGSACHIRN